MNTTAFWVMATRPLLFFLIVVPALAGCVHLVKRFAPPKWQKVLLYKLWTADHEK